MVLSLSLLHPVVQGRKCVLAFCLLSGGLRLTDLVQERSCPRSQAFLTPLGDSVFSRFRLLP